MVQTYTDEKNTVDKEVIPMGPAASQIAIKQLGTNGGVFLELTQHIHLKIPHHYLT